MKNGYRFYPDSRPPRRRPSEGAEEDVNSHLMRMAAYRKALEEIAVTGELTVHGYGSGCLGVLNFVAVRQGQNRRVQIVVVFMTPMATILRFHSSMYIFILTIRYSCYQ